MTTHQTPNQMDSLDNIATPVLTITRTSLANTENALKVPKQAGRRHYVSSYLVATRGATVGTSDVRIRIESEDNVIWNDYIGANSLQGERIGFSFVKHLECGINEDLDIIVDAAGASVITEISLGYYTK